jgi:hypothetical protein
MPPSTPSAPVHTLPTVVLEDVTLANRDGLGVQASGFKWEIAVKHPIFDQ